MKYIVTFNYIYKFHDFALTEFISLCELLNITNLNISPNFKYDIKNEPYAEITFDNIEDQTLCSKITERSVLVKSIIKVYSEGENMDEVVKNLKKEDIIEEMESNKTFKFLVDSRKILLSQKEKIEVMEKIDDFRFKGKCDLKNPDRKFIFFINYPEDNKDQKPYYCFGKLLADQDDEKLRVYSKFELSNRKYLGPTSTDPVLTFIMANLAKVKKGDFVIDPFVGTGSLIIPPSYFGATAFGCDLDIRVLRGYSVGYTKKEGKLVKKEADIFSNFEAYQLESPQIIRQDIGFSFFRKHNNFFDCIICDPPYGYRAGSKVTGMEEKKKEKREKRLNDRINKIEGDDKEEINEEINFDTIYANGEKRLFLPTKQCDVGVIFNNLMNFANDCLKLGGLVVCLFPFKKNQVEVDLCDCPINFPSHENFLLVHACENKYSNFKSRWCLVYKKSK